MHRSVVVVAILVAAGAGYGQAPAGGRFEVVSIRPNVSGDQDSSSMVQPGALYVATNVTLHMLIKTAYGVYDDQIVGGPDWIRRDRFDVVGKGSGNPSPAEFRDAARVMLSAALTERFGLVLDRQQRDIPVYALRPNRSDGRLGPQLVPTDLVKCDGPWQPVASAAGAPEANTPRPCDSAFARPGHIGGRGRDFPTLVKQLSTFSDRIIVDRTGLTGRFDWDLQWSNVALTTDAATTGLSLPTAIQEQFGLKLDPQRSAADVLVVVNASPPRAD